jgi:hypothetical protein
MNWKQTFIKPKWQHKDAEIRLEAVSSGQEPELIAGLFEIARDDEDRRVRCAAIKRLHQLENILKLLDSEQDAEAKKLLEERVRQLASSAGDSRPPLAVRMQVAENTTDRDLIEDLAHNAPEAELRRAALGKVERQGVLGDCAINDPDAGNRRFAASRITQHTSLKRIIDAVRTRDKTLHAELQARLKAELLEQKDADAVQAEALRICLALEKLAVLGAKPDSPEVGELQAAWKPIADAADADMQARHVRVGDRLSGKPEEPPVPEEKPVEPAPEEKAADEAKADEKPANSPADEKLAQAAHDLGLYRQENPDWPRRASVVKLKAQLESAWQRCDQKQPDNLACWKEGSATLKALEDRIERRRAEAEKDLEKARDLLETLGKQLEEGKLHDALQSRATLQKLGKGHGRHPEWQKINRKMHSMHGRLRELREWHHWSNNKVRKRLIAEMEVLPSTDLHPDAMLDRIKSLQKEWKALEQSEQIPGEKHFAAAPWMWRKFSAAGHAAFDAVKPYLEKRSEIQAKHAQSLATFCAELEQLAQAEPKDWAALGRGLNRGRKKLRGLNDVPARHRHKLARKLKAALDKANAVMQEHYADVEVAKTKLIRSASQLVHVDDRKEAISQAKALQAEWKAAGSLWRSREQKLWNEFRSHLDPLFEELKEERAGQRAAEQEKLAAQKALCDAMRDILKADDLAAMHGKVQGLQGEWSDIRFPNRKLQKSFQDMVSDYKRKVASAEREMRDAERERLWLKFYLLHELAVSGRTTKGAVSKKTQTRVAKTWPQDESDDELERGMAQARDDLLAGAAPRLDDETVDSMRERARHLCIHLEFLAGQPSPEEDRERRMKYQVDRLADSMAGEIQRRPVSDEAREVEHEWMTMYTLPEDDFKAFGERVRQALAILTRD